MLCDELIKLHSTNIFKLLNNNKIFNASSLDGVICLKINLGRVL
jgi:hypothetical protein